MKRCGRAFGPVQTQRYRAEDMSFLILKKKRLRLERGQRQVLH